MRFDVLALRRLLTTSSPWCSSPHGKKTIAVEQLTIATKHHISARQVT